MEGLSLFVFWIYLVLIATRLMCCLKWSPTASEFEIAFENYITFFISNITNKIWICLHSKQMWNNTLIIKGSLVTLFFLVYMTIFGKVALWLWEVTFKRAVYNYIYYYIIIIKNFSCSRIFILFFDMVLLSLIVMEWLNTFYFTIHLCLIKNFFAINIDQHCVVF